MSPELACPKCGSDHLNLGKPVVATDYSYITISGICKSCSADFYCDYDLSNIKEYE